MNADICVDFDNGGCRKNSMGFTKKDPSIRVARKSLIFEFWRQNKRANYLDVFIHHDTVFANLPK